MKSGLEIAQEAELRPITEIAAAAGIEPGELEPYGSHRAKIQLSILDRLADLLGSKLGTKKWNQNAIGHSGAPEVADSIGGPSRTRTLDPLIKSQLLYQLS